MTTGAQYVNIKSKRLVGTDDFGLRMMDYMRAIAEETNSRTYDSPMFLDGATSIVADGNDQIRIDKAVTTVVASDAEGHFLDPDWSQWNWFRHVYFQNVIAVNYYVALKHCLIPDGIQINPRTGAPEYVAYEHQVGETDIPGTITDGGTTITFVVDNVLEATVDCSGRRVWVYMVNPAAGASTESIAIEECVVAYVAGQNKITTTGLLGQTTVSTTAADYQVAALGPTIKRYTDLRAVAEYAFIGIVTGVGAGSPPTVFDMSDQRVVPYSWVSALVDGLPQDFIPATDNTYSLGSATKKWSNIYTYNLIVAGDLLPDADGTQDLGSAVKRWAELHLASTATVHDVIPETDATYSLGATSYVWEELWLSNAAGDGVMTDLVPGTTATHSLGVTGYVWEELWLSAAAGDGVQTDLVPGTTATHSLGATSYVWKKLFLSNAAGDGVQTDLVPGVTATYSLGATSYVWEELWLSAIAGDGVQTDLVPGTDATHSLGAVSYIWKKLFLSSAAGDGVYGHLVPVADVWSLGNTTYRWNELYLAKLYLNTAAGDGVMADFIPGADATHSLGVTSYTWEELWLSAAAGDGVMTDLVPGTDATHDLGNATYQWQDIWCTGTANLDTLDLSSAGGEGAASNLNPITTNTYDLGAAAYYWSTIYCSLLYYKTQSTFDDYDDLALIEAYAPGEVVEEVRKGGEVRKVRQGDESTIPWPMLGPPDPDNGGHFIHAPDAVMFLLGSIKQMYLLHKRKVTEFKEIIDGLANRLEQVEATI